MHEHRAMRFTLDHSGILINGVNFDGLLHVNKKDAFTEEDRRHEDFKKFFKRYDYKESDFHRFSIW